MIYAIFALSLELLVGTTGLVSLGHAAFFGIGAYATVLALAATSGALARCWLLPLAIGARRRLRARRRRAEPAHRAASTSSWSRWPSRRWPTSSSTTPRLGGGSDGIYLYVQAGARVGGDAARPRRARCALLLRARARWSSPTAFSRCCCARASATRWPASASTSSACAPPASRPTPTSSPPSSIAGALAGLAGFLLAVKDGVVNPELLSLARVGRGAADDHPRRPRPPARRGDRRGRVHAAEGAVPVARRCSARSPTHWQLTLGLTIIAFVALLPRGLIGLARVRGCAARREPAQRGLAECRMSAAPTCLLRGRRPRRAASAAWSRSTASRSTCSVGEVHAVIGTNGAGKSTLINMLSGEIAPSRRHASRSPATTSPRWSQPRRARAGLGRSYQRTTIFPSSPCSRTAGSPRRRATPRPWAVWERAASDCARQPAAARDARSTPPASTTMPARTAGTLSHGAKRQLEIAMCLATAPARAAARRAAGRHGRRGDRPHAGAARRAEGRRTRSCWSSTTWTRCSASPTASR